MAITLVTTVGGTTSNSYVTLAEANTYFNNRLESCEWATLGATRQSIALVQAARDFNRRVWRGVRVDDDQALAWPRRYVPKPDSDDLFDTDEIPQAVKDAQCERAWQILQTSATSTSSASAAVVSEFTEGDVKIKYDTARRDEGAMNTVSEVLSGLLLSRSVVRA